MKKLVKAGGILANYFLTHPKSRAEVVAIVVAVYEALQHGGAI